MTSKSQHYALRLASPKRYSERPSALLPQSDAGNG